MNVQEIRDALAKNQIVGLKSSNGYKIYPEEAHRDYHRAHFTFDSESNTVLSLRCTSNYFGSLLHESEMNELEVKA